MRLRGVDEPADRVGGDDIGKAADVIGVRMGRHDHVDPLDVPLLEIRDDALPPHPALAGVDEHRLIAELDQDRVPPLPDVDEVDDEIAGEIGADLRLPGGGGTACGDEAGDGACTECDTDQVSCGRHCSLHK